MKFTSIDQYIATFPSEVAEILQKIRQVICQTAPELTEGISYNIPTFYLNGKYIIYFAGYKKHVSIYPVQFEGTPFELELAPYVTGKGTAQFKLGEPIPYDLIKKIVKYRVSK